MKVLKSIFLCSFSVILALFTISCSETEADVVSTSVSTVFDFADKESNPSVRLAIFLQVTNEVQRTESFTVSHEESGYSWTVAKPGIFSGLNKNYAYSANLKAPEGAEIPTGLYSVTYTDAAGNQDEIKFSVNYKKELLTSNSETFREFLPNSNENIALYDDSGELLYMGKAKKTWTTNAAILKDYKLADTKRICYVSGGNSVVCMMPEEKLKTEEN